MTRNQRLCFWQVPRFLAGLFDGGRHGKRVPGQRHPRRHQDRFAFRSRRPARAAPWRAAFRPSPRSSRWTGCGPTRGSISPPHRATLFPPWGDPAQASNWARDWTDFDAAGQRPKARRAAAGNGCAGDFDPCGGARRILAGVLSGAAAKAPEGNRRASLLIAGSGGRRRRKSMPRCRCAPKSPTLTPVDPSTGSGSLAVHARQLAPRLAKGRTGSSNLMTISSTSAASPGTSASTCRGNSCPPDQEKGSIGHDQRDLGSEILR